MTGFLGAPPLPELAASPADLVELARSAHTACEAGDAALHAFLSTDFSGPPVNASGPLSGVPVAVKDNIATTALPTTCGSRLLEGYLSPYDATAVRRLREAGAVVVGKTNLDEFAMGSSTEHSAFGATRNPLDRTKVPGGSSGGSAAAVAAGIVPIALGSETGGSVRQPASFCGVVGLVPTYGAISRYGLIAFASSLDQVGIHGRTVDDTALVFEILRGPDPLDATSRSPRSPAQPTRTHSGDLTDVVIGLPRELFPDSLHPAVTAACRRSVAALESRGATIREVTLPHADLAVAAYQVIAAAEAGSNLARFDGARFGVRVSGETAGEMYERTRAMLGREVKRRVLLGAHVLSEAGAPRYRRARAARDAIAADHRAVFDSGVDLIFAPTTSGPAFARGERLDDPYEMYRSDSLTVPANLAGLPAISIPIGRCEGLPLGGQLIGPPWSEASVLSVARVLEAALSHSSRGGPPADQASPG